MGRGGLGCHWLERIVLANRLRFQTILDILMGPGGGSGLGFQPDTLPEKVRLEV